ncbi:MAG: DNA polymerase III subunit beta [Bdellovibrionaceae bacterium]|nr:DNA polymerase III subunit beta [Pseudobdellovibrionaceae bacterium]
MKIEVQKKDLLNLVAKTQNIVEKRNAMPVLTNVLLEAEKSTLTLFATDLEVSLTDSIEAQVDKPGKCAVSAKKLFEIVKELKENPIKIQKKENNWLLIEQGNYQSHLIGINTDDYPVFPTYSSENFINIERDTLREMIDKTIYSISNDETRFHLNGVFFEIIPSFGFRMVSTDGHRLSLISKENNSLSTDRPIGIIIPKKGLYEIKKLLETLEGTIQIATEGSQFILKNRNLVLMIRLIEGRYPNYQQFIPKQLSKKVQVNRDLFLSAIKKVSMLANEKSKAVLFNITNGKMEISSNNPELGNAKDEIEVQYNGQEMKIGFNARYIQDVLSNMDEEIVDIELNDQVSPGLLRPHNDNYYTCVVMPMKV